MAPRTRSHRVALGARPRLLTSVDGWDPGRHPTSVPVVDLAGATSDEAADQVARFEADIPAGTGFGVAGASAEVLVDAVHAGAGLAIVEVATTPVDGIRALADRGALVVLTGPDPLASVAVADHLAAAGAAGNRVVVEVGPYVDPAAPAEAHLGRSCLIEVLEHAAYSFRVGAVIPATGPEGDEAAEGAEIGALTELLLTGVATVRGPSPRRFHRVLAVVDALTRDQGPGGER